MARSRKKQSDRKKPSPEERLNQLWEQQVFLLNKMYPDYSKKTQEIQKKYAGATKADGFQPTEEALRELNVLYTSLKTTQSATV